MEQRKSEKVDIDDFSLLKVIGKGTYGKVLLVSKKDTGQLFAIKILRKDKIKKSNQVVHTRTERSVLERVSHPYIVKLFYAFQNSKKLYFVLEYCPGGELFYHLNQSRYFKESRAKFYAACILLALEYLHKQSIVYRDLKPENVLIYQDGYPKLTDFGLSKEDISDNSSAHSFCGTPEYLAPEILKREGHGRSVDWWSFGALIYEMLTGLPPFYSQNRDQMFKDIKYGQIKYPAHITPACQDLMEKLFVKDPNQRLGGGESDAEEVKEHP